MHDADRKSIQDGQRRALRLATFAECLDISISLARQWMRCGRIETFKLGKLVMVPASEVDRILAENSKQKIAA
jgi:predicted site-specific integrase-resolvase